MDILVSFDFKKCLTPPKNADLNTGYTNSCTKKTSKTNIALKCWV